MHASGEGQQCLRRGAISYANRCSCIWSIPAAGTPEDVEGVIGGVLLTLPFYKHIFAWMGAHPAGAPSFILQYSLTWQTHMSLSKGSLALWEGSSGWLGLVMPEHLAQSDE